MLCQNHLQNNSENTAIDLQENTYLQQFIKLNPPVTPSTSITSPQKYNPEHFFDSIVFIVISFNLTPPAVTNSSLNTDLPVTSRLNSAIFLARAPTCFFGASAHILSLPNPLARTRADHNLRGIIVDDCSSPSFTFTFRRIKGQEDITSFFGDIVVIDHNCFSISSAFSPNSGAQFMIILVLYFTEWNSRAANADRRNVAGPEIPRCVISNGPSCVTTFFFFLPGTIYK
jgi:hypothetical protein